MKLAGGVVLLITGTIWILQGLDVAFAPKSFMTGDRIWVLWGAMAVVAGLTLTQSARRGRPKE